MRVAVLAYYGTSRSVLVNNAARCVIGVTHRALSIDHSFQLRFKAAVRPHRFRSERTLDPVSGLFLKWNSGPETKRGSKRKLLGVPIKYDLELRILQNIKLKPWDV